MKKGLKKLVTTKLFVFLSVLPISNAKSDSCGILCLSKVKKNQAFHVHSEHRKQAPIHDPSDKAPNPVQQLDSQNSHCSTKKDCNLKSHQYELLITTKNAVSPYRDLPKFNTSFEIIEYSLHSATSFTGKLSDLDTFYQLLPLDFLPILLI